ncbi:LysR family transcriptional regulator [Gemmobacter fulvus]|uniref:LysR family transcriptional regulator n=1 Tax=Gemmobacter fulvus TaxID=2840474 RepID=UPI002796A03D|nr:LysR family transcriptional regulator [Gemmobacter fulvus]MDQ1848126.1 LysR family transcriptional regulator [Gemmobacter fulvus]
MLSLTLRQLEYAVAVARHGGVTAAAEALHVSQPALSVALAQLEAQLGQPLFLRRAGGPMVPTSFGRGWLEAAEAQLHGLVQLMAGAAPAPPVRLAVFEDLAPVLLAPLLRQVRTPVAPQVMGFEALAEALRRGQTDLALTWDLGLEAGIARSELARVVPHAVMAAEHPLAGADLTLALLADQPLILADQGLSLGHMRALFSQRGLVPRLTHRCATLELMRSFAANGLGVGLSYTRPAATVSADGAPLLCRPITDAPGEPVVLAHAQANPLSAAARQLATEITGLPRLLP